MLPLQKSNLKVQKIPCWGRRTEPRLFGFTGLLSLSGKSYSPWIENGRGYLGSRAHRFQGLLECGGQVGEGEMRAGPRT